MKSIVLIGPPGAGKTTLGERAARKLGIPFIDTDREVLRKFRALSAFGGAEILSRYYAALEREALTELLKKNLPCILATGAETPLNLESLKLLKNIGHIILIKRDKESVSADYSRLKTPQWLKREDGMGKLNFLDGYLKDGMDYEKAANAVVYNYGGIETGLIKLLETISLFEN